MKRTGITVKATKFATILACLCIAVLNLNAQTTPVNSKLLSELKFRCIGPAVTGGRIHDVEALPQDPSTIYVATASGGIWKSTNQGTTWKPIFDDQPVSTFGDLAISPSNPNVIWAGTGEQNNRQSTSWGNGVYRSTDGGKTWTHTGLVETRHIGRVRVHPDNHEVAYVAALGNLWKDSSERGVFKTSDGGRSWQKVLYVDEMTGAVDLVMNPSKPNTLYAATYQRRRRTWGFNGGGPGSGIYKTVDGGNNWQKLTNGLPEGDKGRIGLALSKSNPSSLYAIIQHADEGGIYRSQDEGASWTKVNKLNPRPMYYSHIFVDPTDENRVYVLATSFYMSEDGGKTFRQMPTRPTYDVGVHSDFHSLWINPNNPKHFYLAGDAGLHETWDRGETYRRINNLPIGQFYAIGVDMQTPYRVWGGMQDNHSWVGPSATRRWIGIINDDWQQIGFGDGMYHQPDLTDERYVYANAQNGNLTRFDPATGDRLDIQPHPPDREKPYRFDWVTPSLISQHDPRTIYFGGNRLFISKDRGLSWQRTEDLTRQVERDFLFLMGRQGKGKLLSKNDGTASYGEIVTIAESPLDAKILWVGTDDGNVHVSRDGGMSWTDVTGNITGVSDGTYVSRVIASAQTRETAYVTFDAHRDGDWVPYVFKTTDFGKSWRKLTKGLPEDGSVNVIVEHPANPNLLFLGTEHALFVSTTAGQDWAKFEANLPTTLYDDLKIHPRDNDLIVGTHGRSIWILDDLTPLVEWSSDAARAALHLFSIQPATMFHYWKSTSYRGQAAFNGENPVSGAQITYHLARAVDSVEVIVQAPAGDIVRRLTGLGTPNILHRMAWDLRYEPPPFAEDDTEQEGLVKSEQILPHLPRETRPQGPFVSPGIYSVTVQAGVFQATQTVDVKGDPEMSLTQEQWRTREAFLLELLAMQNKIWPAAARGKTIQETLVQHADSLSAHGGLTAKVVENAQAQADSAKSRQKHLRSLRGDIYRLASDINGRGVRQGSLYPPTATHRMRKGQLQVRLQRELKGLKELEDWVALIQPVAGKN
ncbi:hypothetical protein MJD09_15090 [bacterium]|nr:hypothetical protein [bacterium]